MTRRLSVLTILSFLPFSQLTADDISGGPRVNMQTGELIIPCVNVDDPDGPLDGKYFDVKLIQAGEAYQLSSGSEEDAGVCEELIQASLNADVDTTDIHGNLGGTDVPGSPASPSPWVGLIGIDYQPNHYPAGHVFNAHDVFFAGTDGGGSPVTNIYAELAQLKAAGFAVVRSYQTEPYSWVDLIQQANTLGLSVIYEAAIPQTGDQSSIASATQVLENVIDGVGADIFKQTVILVLAGHENYSNTNINYLTSAIRQLQTALSAKGVSTVPVGTALVSGNLVTPGNPADMQSLIDASSPTAPLGFDPYPFQWGVTPPNGAASNASLVNSIAWDYAQVMGQTFYSADTPILMAETGWATEGTGQWADYYCYSQNIPCQPGLDNAAGYLQDLYGFVRQSGNLSGALIFEAYDEPAKSPAHPDNAENHYGLFDTNCALKNQNTRLLPDTEFDTGSHPGCQGFTSGTTFSVVGTQQGAATNQPPFRVEVRQVNPVTQLDADINVRIPTENRTDPSIHPWPYFLLFDGAQVTITGDTSGASCTFNAQVQGTTINWSEPSCTDPSNYPVNCTGNNCFLPWNDF